MNTNSINMFNFKSKSKLMISIEEGSIMLYFKNNVLNKRHFVKDKNDKTVSDSNSCLMSSKKVPLHLVLNYADQNYLLQSISRVNRISVHLSEKQR